MLLMMDESDKKLAQASLGEQLQGLGGVRCQVGLRSCCVCVSPVRTGTVTMSKQGDKISLHFD